MLVMLTWFRGRAHSLALLALLAFAVGNGAIGLHAHTAEGTSVAVKHDASAHRFGEATKQVQTHPLSCLACGWSRTLRQGAQTAFTGVPVAGTGAVLHIPAITARPSAYLAALPPLRAPPHTSVSA